MFYIQTHTKIATVQITETFSIFKRWQNANPEVKEPEVAALGDCKTVEVWVRNEAIDWKNTRLKGEYIPVGEILATR